MSATSPDNGPPKKIRDLLARMDAATVAIDKRMFRLGKQGLQRLTWSSVVDLRALAKTAHNAAMIRLERELDVLATHVERYMNRDPLFTLHDYMDCVNRISMINGQIQRRRAAGQHPETMMDVLGQARRVYAPCDVPLHLQPVGAAGWVTDTGYVGVTVFLWSLHHRQLLQATNAKPTLYFGDDPRTLLNQNITAGVELSVGDLAHGAFTMKHARISSRRLSLHKDLVVEPAPWRGPEAYGALRCDDWLELVQRIRQSELHPLSPERPQPAYIEPVAWGRLASDAKRQEVTVALRDRQSRVLHLCVPMRPEYNRLIDNLEALDAHAESGGREVPAGLFGRARVANGRLCFMPITAVYPQGIALRDDGATTRYAVHLTLDDLAKVQ